ncbi:MAG: hypothetical protein GWN81_19755, partial [Phycisphaerae bacterium]|nr:hypothetical protein [Phycisphaerae bacterium]NIP50707.1 hypothetical protein [Phycisphaerae bacterium]NIU11025.1 hypothetical protein [Phycisphaerae bacterium]NIX01116.1 hypothetical protein [Phycisphaerae bacterium]NIX26456.1 hypothetical protein [Phycisphaerae bacterium]
GTLAIGAAGAKNAALLAAAIISTSDDKAAKRLEQYRGKQTRSIAVKPKKNPSSDILKKVTKK